MTRTPETLAGVGSVDLSGTTALVTGSTSGIGRGAALALGRLGARVVVHGRDPDAGEAAVTELEQVGADGEFVRADFADVEAVRGLAATVRESTDELDVLVNNAGAFLRSAELTDLGVERTFHVNHLSPYLLTAELLDHLATDARVVTTASEVHRQGDYEVGDVTGVEGYSGSTAYARSKLANVQFTYELARRLETAGRDVTANAFHPGGIPGSGFARFLPTPLPQLASLLDPLPFVTSVEEGAAALVSLAASPDVADISGRYFEKQRLATPSMAARDRDAQYRLWTESATLLDIEEPLADAAVDPGVDAADGAKERAE